MATLLWLAGAAVVLTVVGALLSRLFGRGAVKDSFKDPLNEIQGTTSWWNWGP